MRKLKRNKTETFVEKEPFYKNKIFLGCVAVVLLFVLIYGVLMLVNYSIDKHEAKVTITRTNETIQKSQTELDIEKLKLEIEKLKIEQDSEPIIVVPNSAIKTQVIELKPCTSMTGMTVGIYNEGNYSCCKKYVDGERFKCKRYAEYEPTLWQLLLTNMSKDYVMQDDTFIYIKAD